MTPALRSLWSRIAQRAHAGAARVHAAAADLHIALSHWHKRRAARAAARRNGMWRP